MTREATPVSSLTFVKTKSEEEEEKEREVRAIAQSRRLCKLTCVGMRSFECDRITSLLIMVMDCKGQLNDRFLVGLCSHQIVNIHFTRRK